MSVIDEILVISFAGEVSKEKADEMERRVEEKLGCKALVLSHGGHVQHVERIKVADAE